MHSTCDQLNAHYALVTLLSILGTNSIALPLSAAFPAHEIQYILDQSQALMLLSSAKFNKKAQEVIACGLEASPKFIKLEKKLGGGEYLEVTLEDHLCDKSGMMLYTSGTTNRPVSQSKETGREILISSRRKEYYYLNQ